MRFIPTLFVALAAALSAGQAKTYLLKNARLEFADGRLVERTNVLVRDGKIQSIGGPVGASGSLEEVDLSGMTIYPGFISGYSSSGLTIPQPPAPGTPPESRTTAPPTTWDGNRKGIRADVFAADCFKPDGLTDFYKQGILAGLADSSIGTIRGTAAVVAYRAKDPVLNRAFAMDIGWRPNGTGGSSQGYPSTLMGGIALVRQTIWDARVYAQKKAAGASPAADPVYDALAPAATGQMPFLADSDTDREWARAASLAREFGASLIVKSARDITLSLDDIKAAGFPVLLRIDFPDEPVKPNPSPGEDATPDAIFQDRVDAWKVRSQAAKRYFEAGIKFAFSAEGGSIDDFLSNVRRTIAAGLPRLAALKALTVDAASILGISDRYGEIAEGRPASFVVMNGDFAKAETKVTMVFVDGEKIDFVKGGSN